jgi:predicted transcriptional regulator
MRTVRLEVRSLEQTAADFARVWKTGQPDDQARISFASPELLFKVLSGKRWALLQTLAGTGPIAIREAARRAGRDVKAVHADIQALLNAGLLNKTADGKIEFPFETVQVNFTLHAA